MNSAAAALLKAEIAGDPAGRGYSGQSAQAQATLANAPYTTADIALVGQPFKWGRAKSIAQTSPNASWARIEVRARSTPAIPPAGIVDGAILTAINAVSMDVDQIIYPADAASWGALLRGLGALQAVGDLTAADVAAIAALPTHPPVVTQRPPRAVEIFLGVAGAPNTITADDITGALAS